jgi:hypothetical protein
LLTSVSIKQQISFWYLLFAYSPAHAQKCYNMHMCRKGREYSVFQTGKGMHVPFPEKIMHIHGHDIYYVYDKLKKLGMYEAKVVESE